MNERYCEKEQAVVAALHCGGPDVELLAHVGRCALCSEVLLVTEVLREQSTSLDCGFGTPDAAVTWRRAQVRAREKALERTTLPIQIARTCAYALAVLAIPWIGFQLSRRPEWLPNLGLHHLQPIDGNWLAAFTGTTLLGVAAMSICIALSSWYMLRTE